MLIFMKTEVFVKIEIHQCNTVFYSSFLSEKCGLAIVKYEIDMSNSQNYYTFYNYCCNKGLPIPFEH